MGVKELAKTLADKMACPFYHADMDDYDINWQAAYDAMRDEIDDNYCPVAVVRFPEVISE